MKESVMMAAQQLTTALGWRSPLFSPCFSDPWQNWAHTCYSKLSPKCLSHLRSFPIPLDGAEGQGARISMSRNMLDVLPVLFLNVSVLCWV